MNITEESGWVSITSLTEQDGKSVEDLPLIQSKKQRPKSLTEQYAESMVGHLQVGGERTVSPNNRIYAGDIPDLKMLPWDEEDQYLATGVRPKRDTIPCPPPAFIDEPVDNPKQRDGSHKMPLSLCPPSVRVALARVFKIGGEKPGRTHYNWRDEPIRFTQYIDAVHRHLCAYESGEDNDPEMSEMAGSPVSHIDAAMSSLAILVDARESGTLIDDRPRVKGGAAEFLRRVTKK